MSDKSPSDDNFEFTTPSMRIAKMHKTLIHKILPELIIKSSIVNLYTFPHIHDTITKDQAVKFESKLSTFLDQAESFLDNPLIHPPDSRKK